ncbi:MAG: hypothetical protein PW786_02050 [Arachidicoccus sp.]|nr:hypothetical protein [Arachidicoccus sp.]
MRKNDKNVVLLQVFLGLIFLFPIRLLSQKMASVYAGHDVSESINKKTETKAVQSPLLIDVESTLDSIKQKSGKHVHVSKFYYKLAVTFAKMKMYPLALKCFYRSTRKIREISNNIDSTNYNNDDFFSLNQLNDSIFSTSSGEAVAVLGDTILINSLSKKSKSNVVNASDILQPFEDGKVSRAYGIIVHVKQPVRGKRKKIRLFHGDVGHTFISLIKYNADGSNVIRTFGFYPRKSFPLVATPLIPGTAADFKNDAAHDWDEAVGKFISKEQFDLIIDLTKKFTKERYHLSKNNCTDFGLNIASIAGIYIKNTKGKWLLGSGNDPADMGQSIREDAVASNGGNLFICVPD